MKYLFTSIISFFVFSAIGQEKINLDELENSIGKVVEVRGKISNITKVKNGSKSQSIIFVGGVSPNEQLSILVETNSKDDYQFIHQEKFKHGLIIVKGKVELHKGKPRIVVKGIYDLIFLIDEEVPISEIPPIKGN